MIGSLDMDLFLVELSKWGSVFGMAFFLFSSSIPFGLALELNPIAVIFISTLSYSSGAVIMAFFGERIRIWLRNRRQTSNMSQAVSSDTAPTLHPRLQKIWERYGIWGLGIAAPMTVGAQLGAAFGVMMKAPLYRLCMAMTVGALVWSIIITLFFAIGITGIQTVVR